MKRKIEIIVAVLTVAFLLAVCAGCTATKSVVTEYSADGKVTKVTETSESIVKEVTESTKGKTLVMWESGWCAYLSASTATAENPTPTGKMFVGKTDKGLISALPKQNWENLPAVIQATRQGLTVGAEGVKNQ